MGAEMPPTLTRGGTMTQKQQKVELSQVPDVQLKALIYDEQNKAILANNNIQALQKELLNRAKTKVETIDMVEKPTPEEVVEAEPVERVTNEKAQEMVDSGEATIPEEAKVEVKPEEGK